MAVLLGLSVTAVTVLGCLGRASWRLDLLAHFRLQYAVLLLPPVLLTAFGRRWRWCGLFTATLVLNLAWLAPFWWPQPGAVSRGTPLRVVHMNVLTANTRFDDVLTWVFAQDADVVVLQEVNAAWIEAIDAFDTDYRRLDTPSIREDNFGMTVLVRDELTTGPPTTWHTPGDVPAIRVDLDIDGAGLALFSVHTLPPVNRVYGPTNRAQLKDAAARVNAVEGPVILVGDLNATRWAYAMRKLRQDTGLRDAARGFGYHGTWPTSLWWTGMIPIDHVLVGEGVGVADHRVGPDMGSDHRPVVVDLRIGVREGQATTGEPPYP